MLANTIARWQTFTREAYQWRTELSILKKIGLALAMAAITGILAQTRIFLPGNPVPITGQTFAVLMAGVVLGTWWGGISMVMYAVLGIAGIPWFNGGASGIAQLAGPTGGYIIGFIFAALLTGYLTDKYAATHKLLPMFGLMLAADFVLIYVPGLLQLHLWMNVVTGKSMTLVQTLSLGLVPFIAGDIIKALAAGAIGWGVLPGKKKSKYKFQIIPNY